MLMNAARDNVEAKT